MPITPAGVSGPHAACYSSKPSALAAGSNVTARPQAPALQFGFFKSSAGKDPKQNIALIELKGPIFDAAESGKPDSMQVVHQLEAVEEKGFPALVLRINSPGGSPAVSEEIYEAIMRLRAKGTKVVVSMGSSAASGGFWVAMAGDQVIANPTSITGSIGVIGQFSSWKKLREKWGIIDKTLKKGDFKDMGDAYELDKEDKSGRPGPHRKLMEALQTDIHDLFVNAILQGRKSALSEKGHKLTEADIRKVADGRVFTGKQALELGLVDKLGGLSTALETARALIGKPEAKLIPLVQQRKNNLIQMLVERLRGMFGIESPAKAIEAGFKSLVGLLTGTHEALLNRPVALWKPEEH